MLAVSRHNGKNPEGNSKVTNSNKSTINYAKHKAHYVHEYICI